MKGGGSTVTTSTPTGPASNYLNGILANNGQPNYAAVNASTNAADQTMWNNFNNSELPLLNQKASFLGNQSAGIKDLNTAVSQIGQAQSLDNQQAYLGEYNQAQQQALQAANLAGGTISKQEVPGSGATFANILGGGIGLATLANMLFGSGNGSGSGSGGLGNAAVGAGKSAWNWLTGNSGGASSGIYAPGAGVGGSIDPDYTGYVPNNGAPYSTPSTFDVNDPSTWGNSVDASGNYVGDASGASSSGVGLAPSMNFGGYAETGAAPAATTAATDFAGAGGDALGTTAASDAGASFGSGAGATGGLGAGLGGAAAVAAPLAIAALGKESSPVGLSGQYIQGLESGLQAPKGSAQYNNAYFELASLLGDSNHNSNSSLAALAQKYGVQPMSQLFPNISSPGGNLGNSSIYGNIKLQ